MYNANAQWASDTETSVPSDEHGLANSLDGLRIAITIFDSHERLIFANQHFCRLLPSLPPRADLIGRTYEDLIRQEARLGLLDSELCAQLDYFIVARRAQLISVPSQALDIALADGRKLSVQASPIHDGWILHWSDVTEARRDAAELAEMRRRARLDGESAARQDGYLSGVANSSDPGVAQSEESRTVLRTMSHELKTPLNAIIGFSDLMSSMADRLGPEQVKEYAELIHGSGQNLMRLINQIVDLSKIAGGQYDLNRRDVDISSIIWIVKSTLEGAAIAKHIRIDADGAPLGIILSADEAACEIMITQLLDNAIRYTQSGGLIRIAAMRQDGFIRIVVADNGPGVAAKDLARILQPFEQISRAASDEKSAGGGLGLTLVKAFAELHGGRLVLASSPQKGLTATLDLPVTG